MFDGQDFSGGTFFKNCEVIPWHFDLDREFSEDEEKEDDKYLSMHEYLEDCINNNKSFNGFPQYKS